MPTSSPGMLYVAATLLPLLSFFLLLVGGRRWGKAGAYVATAAIGAAFVLSLIGFVTFLSTAPDHGHHEPGEPGLAAHVHEHDKKADRHAADASTPPWSGSVYWAVIHFRDESLPAVGLKLGYYIDGLSAVMFLMVTLIATLIHLFSMGYMHEELEEQVEDHQAHVTRRGRFARFFMFLSLFCFSMLNLVLADNLFQIFLSWELVGVCSYLLISFYYERKSAANAANKAFITNRIGDAGFIIGLLILWTSVGTLNFHSTKGDKGEITSPGIFDTLRSPASDTHGDPMPRPGEFTRATPVQNDKGERLLRIQENGGRVLLFDASTREHFHAPDKRGLVEAYEPPEGTEEHGHGFPSISYALLTLAGLGIFLGCVGKSAQFPLHVWLPDAMEGPTPVSALIHAATMVAAGVYLVGRAFPLFTEEALLVIAYTGAITLFVAGTIAIVQTDIKKVLAYSTVSQLGFMILALGVGGWVAGLFHLITHAFFKALLFLGSGSVIYGVHHEQDMLKMGGLYPKMKCTALTMLAGVLAIAGTPLFSGWYSKDAILVNAFSYVALNPRHFLLFLLPLLTAGITSFYMFRLWFLTFTGEPRDHQVYEHAHESPRIMLIPLIVLAFFSFVAAWGWPPYDVRASWLEHFLHHQGAAPECLRADRFQEKVYGQVDENWFNEQSPLHLLWKDRKLGPHDIVGPLALLSAAIGIALAFALYYVRVLDASFAKAQFRRLHGFLMHKWHFDELYSAMLVRPALVVSQACRWFDTRVIDGVVDWLGRFMVRVSDWDGLFDRYVVDGAVNVTGNTVYGVGSWLRNVQTGLIRNYVLFLALAAVGIFVVLTYVLALAG